MASPRSLTATPALTPSHSQEPEQHQVKAQQQREQPRELQRHEQGALDGDQQAEELAAIAIQRRFRGRLSDKPLRDDDDHTRPNSSHIVGSDEEGPEAAEL